MDIQEFFVVLTLALYTYHFRETNPSLKPRDVPEDEVLETYDFIIVGAGSAGSVLANRLTEIKQWKVLLIEAGGKETAVSSVPLLAPQLRNSPLDWNYTTTKQKILCESLNNECAYPRGHVMGGSSTINIMMYVRGNKADFDEWAEEGNDGWSYDEVLPYFIKMETTLFPQSQYSRTAAQDNALRGRSGPLKVNYSKFKASFIKDLIKAGVELGYENGDYNGVNQSRIDYAQSSSDGVARESSSKAYLNSIRHRDNLNVIENSFVTRVLLEGQTVKSVEYIRNGRKRHVKASKEVILSAGSINSPKLLMLSGIGPQEELQNHGIKVIKDLPVGQNLQDHPLIVVPVTLDRQADYTRDEAYSNKSAENYVKYGIGPLTSAFVQTIAFKGFLGDNIPNGLWFVNLVPSTYKYKQSLEIRGSLVKPLSIGTVKLNSANPYDHPVIDPNFFDVPRDLDVMREVIKEIFRYLETPTMKGFNVQVNEEANKLCMNVIEDRNAFIDCVIANQSTVFYHPVGTTRMGPVWDKTAVVNSQLQVHGIKKLRVIDASVMCSIPRGNTNAAAMMIGEKGADLVKKTYLPKQIPYSPFSQFLFWFT